MGAVLALRFEGAGDAVHRNADQAPVHGVRGARRHGRDDRNARPAGRGELLDLRKDGGIERGERAGGKSLVANCGYGTGYSVLQVIEAVRSTVGRDFDVRYGPRRSGDLIAVLANADRARQEFGWTPKLDNLVTIVSDALRWEEALKRRNS